MQEKKNYILQTITTLLNLEQTPYELDNSPAIDKFVNSDADTLLINALPTKEFKVITSNSQPTEGSIIQITKLSTDPALSNFYKFSLRPAQGYKQLAKQIAHLY